MIEPTSFSWALAPDYMSKIPLQISVAEFWLKKGK